MLTRFRSGCKTATGYGIGAFATHPYIKENRFENDEPESGRLSLVLPAHRGAAGAQAGYGKPGISFPFCNVPLGKLCANLRASTPKPLGMEP
jgi:hypothetical protein